MGKRIELDEYQIENIDKLEFHEELEELSLWTNRISNYEGLATKLKTLPNLKGVWLNENRVADDPEFCSKLFADIPNLQIINTKFTPCCTEWVLKVLCKEHVGTPFSVN